VTIQDYKVGTSIATAVAAKASCNLLVPAVAHTPLLWAAHWATYFLLLNCYCHMSLACRAAHQCLLWRRQWYGPSCWSPPCCDLVLRTRARRVPTSPCDRHRLWIHA